MSENREPREAAELSHAERERYLTADGQRWLVREIAAPSFDRRGGRHLVFLGDSTVRRLRHFPPDWFELSDEQLYHLTDDMSR
jgi:hypothetical protein